MTFDPVGLAADLPDAAAFEHATLDLIAREVGFDAAFFATLDGPPTTRAVDAVRLERALATDVYAAELLPLKDAAARSRGVVVDTSVRSEREVRRCRYHRDFAAPIGGRHSLMAYLSLRGRPLGALMLGRTGRGFARGEVAAIEALLPALSVARASYRVPWRSPPLPDAPTEGPLRRALDRLRGERVLEVRAGAPDLVVRDRGAEREMVAREGDASMVWSRVRRAAPARSGWFYVELFHLAAARARTRTRALFVGAGGAAAVRQFAEVYPGVALDVVDSDPRVVDLAARWFGLGEIPRCAVHVGDGVEMVLGAGRARWDVIVVDAFDAASSPRGFASHAFVAGVRRALRRGGAAAFNAIGPLAGDGPVQALERVARRELDDVRLVPVLDPGERFDPSATRNVVVLGRRDG